MTNHTSSSSPTIVTLPFYVSTILVRTNRPQESLGGTPQQKGLARGQSQICQITRDQREQRLDGPVRLSSERF